MNAEASVIAEIDALIDECMAPGPVDDYSADRYDRCPCGQQWHGLPSDGCPGQLEAIPHTDDFERGEGGLGSDWSSLYPDGGGGSMGGRAIGGVWIGPGGGGGSPLRGFGGAGGGGAQWSTNRPTIRFWATGDTGEMEETEGTLELTPPVEGAPWLLLTEDEGVVVSCRLWLSGDDPNCAHTWDYTDGQIPRCHHCGQEDHPFTPVGTFVGDGPADDGLPPSDLIASCTTAISRSSASTSSRSRTLSA